MAAVAESFFGNLSSSRDAHHLRRASVLHCRALQKDGCYVEQPVDAPSARDKPSSLRDLCLNAVIQGKNWPNNIFLQKLKFGRYSSKNKGTGREDRIQRTE